MWPSSDGVDAPDGIYVPRLGVGNIYENEAFVTELITIGLDIPKNVFQVHGRIARGKVLDFVGEQPKCLVALEA